MWIPSPVAAWRKVSSGRANTNGDDIMKKARVAISAAARSLKEAFRVKRYNMSVFLSALHGMAGSIGVGLTDVGLQLALATTVGDGQRRLGVGGPRLHAQRQAQAQEHTAAEHETKTTGS